MPNYVTRPTGYAVSLQAPYYETGVAMRAYILPANAADLSTTLDRYLNNVTYGSTKYVPLGNRVIACFTNILEVRAGDPSLGYMHEIDVAFFIPALRFEGFIPIPTGVAFFAPYLFVNNPWAMATGREVHGFRKDLAVSYNPTLDVNDPTVWTNDPADLTQVVAWAIETQGTSEKMQPTRLVQVIPPPPPVPVTRVPYNVGEIIHEMIGTGAPTPPSTPSPFAARFQKFPPGRFQPFLMGGPLLPELVSVVATALLQNLSLTVALDIPLVFLRQFRNPYDSLQADVRHVIEATAISGIPTGFKIIEQHQLMFHNTASHPIADELGLPSDVPVAANLTLELNNFDFVLHHAS